MNFWNNEGTFAHTAILMNRGETWMEVVALGFLMITKVLSMVYKTTLVMNALIMSALIYASSFAQIVRNHIARTVCLSLCAGIALSNCANHAESLQLVNVVVITHVTLVVQWANVIRSLVGYLGLLHFLENEVWGCRT